jgi:hypothetical protein|tara:strand:- start:885 stop:1262 length:378 start_codon:yes stop_codon:yes gene_type:complete
MSEAFKQKVNAYCEIDETLKLLQAEIKVNKTKFGELTESIIDYMSSQNLEVCNAGELGVLTLATTISKGSLKKENIKASILELLNDPDLKSVSRDEFAESGADYIMNNRQTEEKRKLKRKKVSNK